MFILITISSCAYLKANPELVQIGVSTIEQVISFYNKDNLINMYDLTKGPNEQTRTFREEYKQYVFRTVENSICVEITCDFADGVLFRQEKQKLITQNKNSCK